MMSGWLTSGLQHDALDREGEDEHHPDREDQREEGRHALLVQPDEGQRREHHHDALREVEHARGLEDQDEAERDQRIEHARDEPFPERLQKKVRRRRHQGERLEEDLVEDVHQRRASMRHAEIGRDHALVALDFVRLAVGDLAAVFEHDDAV